MGTPRAAGRRRVAFRKHSLCHGCGASRVRPTGIEREMGDDLRDLGRLHAVVEGKPHVARHLKRLVTCDQRSEGDDAAVTSTQAGPLPHVPEQALLHILVERGSGAPEFLTAGAGCSSFSSPPLLRMNRSERATRAPQWREVSWQAPVDEPASLLTRMPHDALVFWVGG